jgi:hypothetical protein
MIPRDGKCHREELQRCKTLPKNEPPENGGHRRYRAVHEHRRSGPDIDECLEEKHVADDESDESRQEQPDPDVASRVKGEDPTVDYRSEGREHEEGEDQPYEIYLERSNPPAGRFE